MPLKPGEKSLRVSVIIPNYNYARFLEERIDSVINQTYENVEIIVLDDASTDDSLNTILAYAEKDERINLYRNDVNSGNPFIQWDKGVSLAKGDLIWIAEADDVCELDFLEKIIPELENNKAAIAFCSSQTLDENSQKGDLWTYNTEVVNQELFRSSSLMNGYKLIHEALLFENVIPNVSAVVFRRDAYKRLGGVDLELNSNADWFLWLKFAFTERIYHLAKPLNYFRRHKSSVIASKTNSLDRYVERFDRSMRKKLLDHIKTNCVNVDRSFVRYNRKLIQFDNGINIFLNWENLKQVS